MNQVIEENGFNFFVIFSRLVNKKWVFLCFFLDSGGWILYEMMCLFFFSDLLLGKMAIVCTHGGGLDLATYSRRQRCFFLRPISQSRPSCASRVRRANMGLG